MNNLTKRAAGVINPVKFRNMITAIMIELWDNNDSDLEEEDASLEETVRLLAAGTLSDYDAYQHLLRAKCDHPLNQLSGFVISAFCCKGMFDQANYAKIIIQMAIQLSSTPSIINQIVEQYVDVADPASIGERQFVVGVADTNLLYCDTDVFIAGVKYGIPHIDTNKWGTYNYEDQQNMIGNRVVHLDSSSAQQHATVMAEVAKIGSSSTKRSNKHD